MTEEYSMEFTKEDELLDHIAELEKENAELKKKCYKKAVKDYCELEKKNAELEAELKKWKDEMARTGAKRK